MEANRRYGRVMVVAGEKCLGWTDPQRAEHLAKAANAEAIRERKTRTIVRILLHEAGDDSRIPSKYGNPLKLSTDYETPDNPVNVWTLKRLNWLPA